MLLYSLGYASVCALHDVFFFPIFRTFHLPVSLLQCQTYRASTNTRWHFD